MKLFKLIAAIATLFVASPETIQATDWISDPSFYTHSPTTGHRVSQFTPIGPFYIFPRPDYIESGFAHERSSLRVGDSADNYVRISRWGEPVRPYGEWQFPYRPYSVPYDLWGAPFGPFGFGPWGVHGPEAFFGHHAGTKSGARAHRELPYALPFTDDTWYDRRTRPQGRRRHQFDKRSSSFKHDKHYDTKGDGPGHKKQSRDEKQYHDHDHHHDTGGHHAKY